MACTHAGILSSAKQTFPTEMQTMPNDVNIYCDESRYSNPGDPYLVIGAVKCLRDKKPEIVAALNEIKRQYGIGGEFGWKSASPNKEDFYKAVIDRKCEASHFLSNAKLHIMRSWADGIAL
jgi:hypothetical protein